MTLKLIRPGPSSRCTSSAQPITRFDSSSSSILRVLRALRGAIHLVSLWCEQVRTLLISLMVAGIPLLFLGSGTLDIGGYSVSRSISAEFILASSMMLACGSLAIPALFRLPWASRATAIALVALTAYPMVFFAHSIKDWGSSIITVLVSTGFAYYLWTHWPAPRRTVDIKS